MDLAPPILSNKQRLLAEIRSKNLGFMLQNGGLLPFLKRMAKYSATLSNKWNFS